jgi:hypothetical protein
MWVGASTTLIEMCMLLGFIAVYKCDLYSFGMLQCRLVVTDVLEQLVGPIFKSQSVQDWTADLSGQPFGLIWVKASLTTYHSMLSELSGI